MLGLHCVDGLGLVLGIGVGWAFRNLRNRGLGRGWGYMDIGYLWLGVGGGFWDFNDLGAHP